MSAKVPKLVAAAGPSTASTDHAASPSAKDLAVSKRQKKREVDRRCQREARQRTKTRIAYLEALVDELRQQDTSGQVASLMQQIAEARNERDQFARTLRGIEDSIRGHRELLEGEPTVEQSRSDNDSKAESGTSPSVRQPSFNFVAVTGSSHPTTKAPNLPPPSSVKAFHSPSQPALHHSDAYGLSVMPGHIRRELIIPSSSGGACPYCETIEAETASGHPRPQSIWRFANDVLDARPQLTPGELQWEDECAEDTPVRAVVEGWDATAQRLGGTLPPLWRALREIDEGVFGGVQPVERLAIMRLMHLLYRYHADPTSQAAKVPSWFLARPSQTIEHAYAIDFFCWPGLRERFVFSEHSYCTDLFWHLLNKSLRILWQFDFRDCYTLNRHTGQYSVSSLFEARIGNINAWTMGPAFFQQWPELYADIPSFEAAAMAMDRMSLTDDARERRDTVLRSEKRETASTNKPVIDGVVDGIDIDGMSQPILPRQRRLQEGSGESEDDNDSMVEDGPGEIVEVHPYGQPSRRGSQFAPAGKRRQLYHFQQSGGSQLQYTNPPGDPANHPAYLHMAAAAPHMATEISRIRSMELIPQHDWPWLTDGLADGRGMQGEEGGHDGEL